jgi:hypothetical protein
MSVIETLAPVRILGDRAICPSCDRIVEAELFRDRSGALRCGQCGTRRKRRGGVVVLLGCGRASAVPIAQKPGTREAL